MREIKFRIWDKEKKSMASSMWPKMKIYNDGEKTTIGFVEFDELFLLMQFTGLVDKNGVDIYEGDIVCWFAYSGVVKWRQKNMGYMIQYLNQAGFAEILTSESYEVVGNIYENLEKFQ